jgi:hypothetical protein
MTLTLVPETSNATTTLAVELRMQIIQLHGAPSSLIIHSRSCKITASLTKNKETLPHRSSSPLVPVLCQANSAHVVASNTPKIYSIIPPKPRSSKWPLPSGLRCFVFIPCMLHSQPMFPNFIFLHTN